LSGAEPASDTAIAGKQGSESHDIAPNDHTLGQSVGNPTGPDAVEVALADAITKAANAGAFEVLPRLVAELEARRKARLEVVDLGTERAKRGKK
jgi:fumarate hydratase class II